MEDPCPAIRRDFGEFEVELRLPKAVLRAGGGLYYRSKSALATVKSPTGPETKSRLVVLEEEFKIEKIVCYCILGINPPERVEKQAVHVSLEFKGPALQQWGSTFTDTYQKFTVEVAEVSSMIPRIVTIYISWSIVTLRILTAR